MTKSTTMAMATVTTTEMIMYVDENDPDRGDDHCAYATIH